jgi:hypothetical protein
MGDSANVVEAVAVIAIYFFQDVIRVKLVETWMRLHAGVRVDVSKCLGRETSISTYARINIEDYDDDSETEQFLHRRQRRCRSASLDVLVSALNSQECPSEHAMYNTSDDEMDHSFSVEDIFITEVFCAVQNTEDKWSSGADTSTSTFNALPNRSDSFYAGKASEEGSLVLDSLQQHDLESMASSASSLQSSGLEAKAHCNSEVLNVLKRLKDKKPRQRIHRSTYYRSWPSPNHLNVSRVSAPEKIHNKDMRPRKPVRCRSSDTSHSFPQKESIVRQKRGGNSQSSVHDLRQRDELSRQRSLRHARSSTLNFCRSDKEILQRLSLSGSNLNFVV